MSTLILSLYSLFLLALGGLVGAWGVVKWLDRPAPALGPVAARRWWSNRNRGRG